MDYRRSTRVPLKSYVRVAVQFFTTIRNMKTFHDFFYPNTDAAYNAVAKTVVTITAVAWILLPGPDTELSLLLLEVVPPDVVGERVGRLVEGAQPHVQEM